MNQPGNKTSIMKMGGVVIAVFLTAGCLDSKLANQAGTFRVNHIVIDPDPHYDTSATTTTSTTLLGVTTSTTSTTLPGTHIPDYSHHGTVYVATDGGGIFRSVNGGENWENVNFGLTDFHINWIEFDRIDRLQIVGQNRYIYAGTENGGIFRSIDGGNFWLHLDSFPASQVSSIIVDRNTCLSPPACTHVYASSSDGVFISDDWGENWSSLFGGALTPPAEITRLGIYDNELTPPSNLYAGTATGDVFKLTNPAGSTNWEAMAKPGPSDEVYSFAFFGPDQIYVGIGGVPGVRGIYQSITPPPGSWARISDGILGSNDVRFIFSDPTTSGAGTLLYADAQGISKSMDLGASWTQVAGDIPPGDPGTKDVFWAAIDYHRFDALEPDLTIRKKVLYFSTFSNLLWKYSDDITPGTWEWRALDISN